MVGSTAPLIGILIPILVLAISLAVLYFIIRAAIVSALQRARREAWTEDNMPENAGWLSERQRQELAEYNARRDGRSPGTAGTP